MFAISRRLLQAAGAAAGNTGYGSGGTGFSGSGSEPPKKETKDGFGNGGPLGSMPMGMSIADMRERLDAVRARSNVPLWKRLESEMAFAHLLSQTGREKEAKECLQIGDDVWRQITEAKQSQGALSGAGMGMQLCTTMRRAAKTMDDDALMLLWMRRLEERQHAQMDAARATGQEKKRFQVDHRGVKMQVQRGDAAIIGMWKGLTYPLAEMPHLQSPNKKANPDQGPRGD
jgi:hypothetical protein